MGPGQFDAGVNGLTRISLTFSAGGQMAFTSEQNYLNSTFLLEKLFTGWANLPGKIILTAAQFTRFLALNEASTLIQLTQYLVLPM